MVALRSRAATAFAGADWMETFALTICAVVLFLVPTSRVLVGVGVAGVIAERLWKWRPQNAFRTGWRTDVCHGFLSTTLAGGFMAFALVGAENATHPWLASLRDSVAAQPAVLQFIECAVSIDLGAYIAHRLAHAVPFLWRFHAVHHSSEEVDWLSAVRTHPFEVLWMGLLQMLPAYLIGIPLPIIILWRYIVAGIGPFTHANIKTSFGPLWWVLAGPDFHRWHHSRQRRPSNSNFAVAFPIWDVLFKTVYKSADKTVGRFGLPYPFPTAYFDQLAAPFAPQGEQPTDVVEAAPSVADPIPASQLS